MTIVVGRKCEALTGSLKTTVPMSAFYVGMLVARWIFKETLIVTVSTRLQCLHDFNRGEVCNGRCC